MNMQTIQNGADLVLLYQPLNLYLKPNANITITISFPTDVSAGKTISNFDVMDKLRQMILPDNFSLLKVSKTTVEYIKFEAELDDRNKLKNVIARLDARKVKLNGFSDYSQVKAAETKCDFATRHDWDSFFRDAKNMDEMKAGERPDTIYLSGLPIKWFCPRHHENDENVKPSESLFKRIFEKYGDVRVVDIPICDIYRNQMKTALTGLKNFSFDNDTYFEGYVQFSEYGSFVRAMDEFRGMKLVRKDVDKLVAVNIFVMFDKTKHLSDSSVKRRKVIRDRLIEKDREKAEIEEKKLREEQAKKEKERQKEEALKQILLEKQRQREERRKQKYIQKITQEESSELTKKIHKEQKKLLKAQRKVESIRLLEALFNRIKTKYSAEDTKGPSKDFKAFDLRTKLNKKKKGELIKPSDIKKERSLSITSISSNDSILSDKNNKKKSKKKRDSSSSSSSSSSDSSTSSHHDRKKKPTALVPSNNMYPGWMNHPETGEWIPAANYMYAPPFFPGMVRPYFNPNFRGGYQTRPRGRGWGRGRGYYSNHDSDGRYRRRYNDDDYGEHDRRSPRRRYSRSYSRSRSRSRSRSHRRRKSYSRSKSRSSRRNRSRHSRSKSRSSRSKSRHDSRSSSRRKLVTTLRDGDTNKVPPSTRRNRSRSGSGWSSSDNYRKSGRSKRSWSRNTPPREKLGLEPEKLLKSAREIQIHVQQKLKEQEEAKEKRMKELQNGNDSDHSNKSHKRSASVDSSKFRSPKRTVKSKTPDLVLGS